MTRTISCNVNIGNSTKKFAEPMRVLATVFDRNDVSTLFELDSTTVLNNKYEEIERNSYVRLKHVSTGLISISTEYCM